MIPTLLLLGAGKRRRIWIPLPFFLLWPFWLLAWVIWLPGWIFGRSWASAFREALLMLTRLGGLRVDLDSADGTRIHLRFV